MVMGSLQQTIAPLPPLVTIISELHLAQTYRLPTSLTTLRRPQLVLIAA